LRWVFALGVLLVGLGLVMLGVFRGLGPARRSGRRPA
jgi:Na+-driven multidrug efflux pump